MGLCGTQVPSRPEGALKDGAARVFQDALPPSGDFSPSYTDGLEGTLDPRDEPSSGAQVDLERILPAQRRMLDPHRRRVVYLVADQNASRDPPPRKESGTSTDWRPLPMNALSPIAWGDGPTRDRGARATRPNRPVPRVPLASVARAA